MLQSNGYFSFKKKDGSEVHLLFNTWTFRKFSEIRKLGLMEMYETLGASMGLDAYTDLLYCGALSYNAKHKIREEISDYEFTEWMDEAKFLQDPELMGSLGASIRQWIEPNLPPEPKVEDDEEKKS